MIRPQLMPFRAGFGHYGAFLNNSDIRRFNDLCESGAMDIEGFQGVTDPEILLGCLVANALREIQLRQQRREHQLCQITTDPSHTSDKSESECAR